jgi:hypothetical protein
MKLKRWLRLICYEIKKMKEVINKKMSMIIIVINGSMIMNECP